MQRQGSWIGNRLVIAIIGALLVGGISAAIVGFGTLPHVTASAGTTGGASPTATTAANNVTASGTVQQIDPINQDFSVQESDNSLQLVDVTSATRFTGGATSFTDLQIGAQVTVIGTLQVDGSISAVTVNVSGG